MVKEIILLKDIQQKQENNSRSDLSDKKSSNKDVKLIGNLWQPIDWEIEREIEL